MQLILTDDIENLGRRGQVVDVAAGYGRNFLIPKGLGLPATKANLKMIEQQKIAHAKKETKLHEEAVVLAGELEKLHLVVSRKAGETGILFGSVTSKDIAELLEDNGIHVDRRKVLLEHPIKQIGNATVKLHPHSDVYASVTVSVMAEQQEEVAKVLRKGTESDKIMLETSRQAEEFARIAAEEAPKEGTEGE